MFLSSTLKKFSYVALLSSIGVSFLGVRAITGNTSTSRNVIFSETFAGGDLQNWGKDIAWKHEGKKFTEPGTEICCNHSVKLDDSIAREGRHSARFTLYKDDPLATNSKRAELRLGAVPTKSEYWYGFSIYLPPGYIKDPSFEIVNQWNARPDFKLGEKWRSPQLALVTADGKWHVHRRWDHQQVTKNNTPAGKETITLGAYQTGVWTDWVFRVKWSYEADGLVEVWKNGKLVVRKTGPNTYNDEVGPYQKFGVYKTDWKHHPEKSRASVRVLYFDSIRMGDASAEYADVAPGERRP
ncbi:hypothetical protein Glo7428_1295 [Gloeocapsa sp. PCC 7428]|uniref:polysaccharide lyase n=1 Tax=Gloeocapsa sp. PCC 7428 TaxID=1173026 RepID=UPI0002A5D08B|nr:polysaccharide lyase [Gloeocapsa sp. PCC 7428]AFZ29864.1 hypothetical protein Glo7428_1295 [Gloeocapsa sp. PCC 7428]